MKKKLIIIISAVLVVIAVVVGIVYFIVRVPDNYMIESDITFKYQNTDVECSGYSSYHALEILGHDVDPREFYSGITNKNPDGTVSPLTLRNYLKESGYDVKIGQNSNLDSLKKMVSKNKPVIVSVKISPTNSSLHYIVIVGYDKDNVYAIDSVLSYANEITKNYNRKISNSDFEIMWHDDDVYYNSYIRFE